VQVTAYFRKNTSVSIAVATLVLCSCFLYPASALAKLANYKTGREPASTKGGRHFAKFAKFANAFNIFECFFFTNFCIISSAFSHREV